MASGWAFTDPDPKSLFGLVREIFPFLSATTRAMGPEWRIVLVGSEGLAMANGGAVGGGVVGSG